MTDIVRSAPEAHINSLDVLPLVKHYFDELGLHLIFDKYVPNKNNADIDPAQVLCVMVMNIVDASRPLYQVAEWLGPYFDGLSEPLDHATKYNDDRLGRTLDVLFESDRSSMMMEITASAIEVHELDIDRIHNDSTSITFEGAYQNTDEDAVKLVRGYNKDYRPDCKQIVFGLNITEDGHVPLSYHLYDGNQADITTHRPNWDALREQLGKEDFIYTADSKLCSEKNVDHIADHGGKFISLLPRTFIEVNLFLETVREGKELHWTHEFCLRDSRKKNTSVIYRIHQGELGRGGYRILWIHSSAKQEKDEKRRESIIKKSEEALEKLSSGLNRYQLKTSASIEKAIKKSCKNAKNFIHVDLIESKMSIKTKVGRGRPGCQVQYETKEVITYELVWHRDDKAIIKDARADGLFPLIDNTELDAPDVLLTYKKQPYLEKRFATKKSVLNVAPVFLKKPRRIEAMMFLYFIALMIVSLIERQMRQEMQAQEIMSLPILPSKLKTKTPTWNNLRTFFGSVHLAKVIQDNQVLSHVVKGLTELHYKLLQLLKVPRSTYEILQDDWWVFSR